MTFPDSVPAGSPVADTCRFPRKRTAGQGRVLGDWKYPQRTGDLSPRETVLLSMSASFDVSAGLDYHDLFPSHRWKPGLNGKLGEKELLGIPQPADQGQNSLPLGSAGPISLHACDPL